MKRFYALLFTLVGITLGTFARDIYINDFKIKAGETKTVEIITDNHAIAGQAFGCRITLPEGLNYVDNVNSNTQFTDRLVKGQIDVAFNPKGNLCINVFTATIEEGVGTIVTFDVKASDTFTGGQIRVSKKGIGLNEDIPDSYTTVSLEENAPVRTEVVYIEDFTIPQGKVKKLETILNVETGIVGQAFGFRVTLPAGLSWVDNVNSNAEFTERLIKGQVDIAFNPKNQLCVNVFTATINPGTSPIVTFDIKADDNFEEGEIRLSKIGYGLKEDYPDVYVTVVGTPGTSIDAIQTVTDNAVIYNIAGQRVNANAKGLVIKNGKKFINK